MKKRIVMAFLWGLTVLLFASCHGGKSLTEFILPEELDLSRTYHLTFWAKNDSNPTQRQIYDDAIADFEALYPNIDVEIVHYTSYPDLYATILLNIGTKTTPNVAIAYPDHVAAYLESPNLIVELEQLIDHPKYGLGGADVRFEAPLKDEFVTQYLEEGYIRNAYDGKTHLYTLPFMRSTECLYVNKTYLTEHQIPIPEDNIFTWDEIWSICRQALVDDPTMIPLIYQSSDNFFIELAYQNGYDFTTDEGDLLFNNADNRAMVQNLNELYKEGLYVTKAMTGIYPGDKFNKGECIFGIDSSAGSTWMGPSSPLGHTTQTGEDFEVLVTTIPQVDKTNPQVISQGPSLCLFNKEDPQEVLASWLFMQYLLTNEVQISYAQTEGYSPVTTKAIESTEFQAFLNSEDIYDVQKAAILNVMEYKDKTFTTPAFVGSADVRKQVGRIIDSASQSKKKEIDVYALFKTAMNNCRR